MVQLYSRLADDIHSGGPGNVPDFGDAVHALRLLDQVISVTSAAAS
ncbi:MAG TPA: hypothetical protein VK586_10610 [Streptosporangiaceae bacterium]|nr:hypothetical protein [Streptosporangiaceae bacterium]